MPPRFAYWTILIDDKPTAFRARDQQELMPTFAQLKRTNERVEVKWFAQGRLWDSPDAQRNAGRPPKSSGEKRGGDWRPGGQHKDPRARFDKEAQRRKKREQRAEWNASRGGDAERRDRQPTDQRPPRPPALGGGSDRQRENRPPDREGWQRKPPRDGQRPWTNKPPRDGQRPWSNKPPRDGQRPWSDKPPREGQRPWSNKPPRDGQRPSSNKPPREGQRPWSNKPPRPPGAPLAGPAAKPRAPQGSDQKPHDPRRRRRDEPPDHE